MYLWCLLQIICGNTQHLDDKKWCGRQTANECLSRITPHQLLSNVALVVGVPAQHMTKSVIACRVGQALIRWTERGFPPCLGGCAFSLLRQVHGLILEWLFSDRLVSHRGDADVWRLSCSLASVLGLHDLAHRNTKRQFLRVMMRSFGTSTQKALLSNNFGNREWKSYVNCVFASIWSPAACQQLQHYISFGFPKASSGMLAKRIYFAMALFRIPLAL